MVQDHVVGRAPTIERFITALGKSRTLAGQGVEGCEEQYTTF